MEKKKVLVADDDESILWVLGNFFMDKGLEVLKAKDGHEAARLMKDPGLTLAVVDINMPGRDGLDVLKGAKAAGSPVQIIIMTAETTMKNTLEAMKLGAFDYIAKPFDLEELDITVDRALENITLREKLSSLTERLKEKLSDETVFIGRSRAVQSIFKTVGKVAPKDVTVLILGESGTGKELLARLIHMNSPRSDDPFIAVNTAAVPRELMESELFGFEKGAFTGAVEGKKGKFELADKGTIFLDEVGDMSAELQARLLRVTQDGEFFRIGGKEAMKADVRIIAATNQNLDTAVAEGRFRADLLFRLNGVTVTLPPLRERRTDIKLLAEYFLEKYARDLDCERRTLSPEALEALEEYHWPGNVRELENVLRRSVLLSPSLMLGPLDLDLPKTKHAGDNTGSLEEIIIARLKPFIDKTDLKDARDLYELVMPFLERPLLRLLLEKTRGNQVQTADALGINRNTLRKKIKKLKINLKKIKQ
jgi:two-component system nitrogen regulation response regulator GlnG